MPFLWAKLVDVLLFTINESGLSAPPQTASDLHFIFIFLLPASNILSPKNKYSLASLLIHSVMTKKKKTK